MWSAGIDETAVECGALTVCRLRFISVRTRTAAQRPLCCSRGEQDRPNGLLWAGWCSAVPVPPIIGLPTMLKLEFSLITFTVLITLAWNASLIWAAIYVAPHVF
jgi:hypothetical protein